MTELCVSFCSPPPPSCGGTKRPLGQLHCGREDIYVCVWGRKISCAKNKMCMSPFKKMNWIEFWMMNRDAKCQSPAASSHSSFKQWFPNPKNFHHLPHPGRQMWNSQKIPMYIPKSKSFRPAVGITSRDILKNKILFYISEGDIYYLCIP
jgi:hypothetical protein